MFFFYCSFEYKQPITKLCGTAVTCSTASTPKEGSLHRYPEINTELTVGTVSTLQSPAETPAHSIWTVYVCARALAHVHARACAKDLELAVKDLKLQFCQSVSSFIAKFPTAALWCWGCFMVIKNGSMPDCDHLPCDCTTNPGLLYHKKEIHCTVDGYLHDVRVSFLICSFVSCKSGWNLIMT